MKILLINPPLPNFNENPYPPLGLAYMGAVLENEGYEVKIVDMPPLGLEINSVRNYILKFSPDLVGITCVAANYRYCIDIARTVKQINPFCKIIVGGPHVTFIAEKVLYDNSWVDIVVRGEGEETMLELVQLFEGGMEDLNSIKGISFRRFPKGIYSTNERPFINKLDSIPYPARHMLPMDKYKQLTKYTSVITSRGCVYNCIYCNASAFWKHKIRFRTPLSVYEEIKFLKGSYGIKHFKFVDDLFLFEEKRNDVLLKLLEKLEIKWICNTRIDLLNNKLIENAAQAGCEKMIFGIESLSTKVQKVIKKNIKISQHEIIEVLEMCHKNGIHTKLNFIIGLPSQMKEDIGNIKKLILRSKPTEIAINALTPYPGTYLVEHFENLGIHYNMPERYDEEKQKSIYLSNTYLSKKDISNYLISIKQFATSVDTKTMEGY
jgi:radical SAM superfamily enzyme YgiQ (UPF0313 family)